MEEQMTYTRMLKDRQFLRIFLAGLISRFGDAVDMIAYGFMVYQLTGSAALMAGLYAVNGIPSLFFTMISGVVVTRLPKKHVIWVCDFLRGSVVLLTALLYFYNGLQVWHLYFFTMLNASFESFRAPSNGALFVQMIPRDKIEHATSLNTSARTFAELLGYGMASMIIGLLGVAGAIVLDAVTFFVAGLLIMTLNHKHEVLVKKKLTLKVYVAELKEGIDYALSVPIIRNITLFLGGIMMMIAPFNALQIPYILETLQLDQTGIAVMSVAFMVAMIIGSLLVPTVTKKYGGRKAFIFGGLVLGVGYGGFSIIEVLSGTFYAYIGLGLVSFIMGSTISFMQVPITTCLMGKVDHALITRVMALTNVMGLAAVPIGGGLSGLLVNHIEIPRLFMMTSIGIMLLFLTQIFNRSLYELNMGSSDQTFGQP